MLVVVCSDKFVYYCGIGILFGIGIEYGAVGVAAVLDHRYFNMLFHQYHQHSNFEYFQIHINHDCRNHILRPHNDQPRQLSLTNIQSIFYKKHHELFHYFIRKLLTVYFELGHGVDIIDRNIE